MKLQGFILFVYTILTEAYAEDESPIVITPLGSLKGSTTISRLGRTIYSFRGIRYAEPPVNELRFQPPVPVKKWNGTYDATKDGPMCPQPSDDYPISEDCLILNVYTTELPNATANPRRPVIVYIHAGGFYSVGSISHYAGPNYFLDQNIVLVTINYRLATLGFLSTGTKEAPGNNGLKDQVQALKWIQQNIESFGGDKNSVTLMGYSAGGVSVILHMMSPMSKGLFHKAIAMSGSPLGALPFKSDQLDLAKKQARLVGCPDDSVSNIISCLKNVSYKALGDSLLYFDEFGYEPIFIWVPTIEKDFGQERFLTAHPVNLIRQNKFQKMPLITGQTELEFGYRAFYILANSTLTAELNNDFDRVAPIAFVYERDTPHSKIVSRGLRKFYFKNQAIGQSTFNGLSDIFADSIIGFSNNRAAKLISQHSEASVYYYEFSFRGRYSHFYLPNSNNTKTYGAVHHDDLIYLFYIDAIFPLFQDKASPEAKMVATLTELYANFAKTGKPCLKHNESLKGKKWTPYTLENQIYLNINDSLELKHKLYEDRYAEWERLYPLSYYDDK